VSFKAALLAGAKGGGGSYHNTADNLRSTDTFEILMGFGTGRIRLAPGGLSNLYVNDVPVEDGQGNASFKDFAAVLFDGDPTVLQPVKLNLGASSGPNTVGLTLTNTYSSGPGDWKNATVTEPGVDYIDLRFVVQQLYAQTKDGIGGATATIQVELRPSGTTNWINPLLSVAAPLPYNPGGNPFLFLLLYAMRKKYDPTGTQWLDANPGVLPITGKTTSPYVKELRIAVPNDGAYANKTWEVRCRLNQKDYIVSGDNGENETRRTIVWESVAGASTEPIGGTEEWRGLSYLQLFGKASDQINGIPELKGVCDLDLYPVPPSSVWDPTTRVYTGAAWDGATTQLAWTQCPAWQIKKLIEDDLSGVSALAPGSTLNKWDALEASKWFAEQVPDGKGGFHPRYSANWFIDQPMQVNDLVNYLAGAVGAFAWDEGDGKWRLKVEKPETPQMIFTKETIVGEFNYQHTDIDTRYNSITAVFRNRDNRYEEDRVRVFDQADIDATGIRHTSIVLVGCDNRQEALRRAYIRLLTALNEKRMVTFKTNRAAGLLEQLSVIGVADGDLNSSTAMRSTGRVVAMNLDRTQISVRDTLRLELGVDYTLHVTVPNPDYAPDTVGEPTSEDWRKPTITITRNIVNDASQRGDVYDLYLDEALPANTPEFAAVALEAVGLPALPKQYRVLGVTPDDDGEFAAVSAIEIYTSKWVESDAITEEEINSQLSSKIIEPPTIPDAGMFRIDTYSSDVANRRVLVTSWDRPAGRFVEGYRVSYRYNEGPWIVVAPKTLDTFYELPDPAPGTYDFQIVTLDRRGVESLPLESSVALDDHAILTWDNLGSIPSNLAELVGTEAIQNKTILDSISNDDVLSAQEKIGKLIGLSGDLEARYSDLFKRGALLGISTTALIAARSNWWALLGSYSPAWNDTKQDTSIYTPAFGDKNFPTSWGATAGVAASGIYSTLTDSDASAYQNMSRSRLVADIPGKVVSGPGYLFSAGFRIKKDATGRATRFPSLRIACYDAAFATLKMGEIYVDTSTGEYSSGGSPASVGVLDLGSEWLAFVSVESTAATINMGIELYPAVGASATWVLNSATTGSVDIAPPTFACGDSGKLGHYILNGRMNAYAAAMTSLASAIGARDGSTSVIIDPPTDVIISADSAGVVKTGELPRDVGLKASVGTADVTQLGGWTRTAVNGVTCTIDGTTGILTITAMTVSEVSIPVTFTYTGITRTVNVHVVRRDDQATNNGGSTGAPSVTTTILGNTAGSAYNTTSAVSATLTAIAGASGQVSLTAPISFKRNASAAGSSGAAGKWQWRIVGGTFADVAAEVTSIEDAQTEGGTGGEPLTQSVGWLSVSQTKTGLTNGTKYEFRFLWRETSGSARLYRSDGTLGATGS
jgi:hypothetical protein